MINTSNLLSNAASFGMCADAAMATGFDMYNKYYILGQSVDSDTKWEVLSLGMSVLGSVVSAKGMSKSTKELSDLLQKEGFTNALKEEVFGLANGFKRTPDIMSGGSGMGMNLQFFGGGKSGRKTEVIMPSKPHTNGTQGHWETILDEVDIMKSSGDYSKIYVNKGLSNEIPGAKPNRRPDIMGVRNNGLIDQVEVPSKTDIPDLLIDRMIDNQRIIGDRTGNIKIRNIGGN